MNHSDTEVRNGLGKHIVNVPIGDLRKYFMVCHPISN